MAKRDAFIDEFKKLLEKFAAEYSLPQWQFAYRQVIYTMGMEILQNFPGDVVGPAPSGLQAEGPPHAGGSPGKGLTESAAGTGGPGPGHHPSIICEFGCLVLGVTPSGGKHPPPGPL